MTLPPPFVAALRDALPDASLTADAERIAPHLIEWRGRYRGEADWLALPGSTEEVARIVRLASAHGVALVARGGGTGLVGAGVPRAGELPVSFARLRRLRALDPTDGSLIGEAGLPLAEAQAAAKEAGLLLPLTIASEGSATLGGIAATNAGGVHVLRYGMARDLVLGLEAVLADGRVWHGLSRLRKDNTGYDLKHLLVGSEGTLGLITAVAVKLVPATPHRSVALVGLDSPEAALALLTRARGALGDTLNAAELMPRFGIELAIRHLGADDPLGPSHPWFVLLETASGSAPARLTAAMEDLLAAEMEAGRIGAALIAQSEAQAEALWALRHGLSEAQKHEGGSIKHDIAVPVGAVPGFLAEALAAVTAQVPGCRPCPFGHLGDGNLHFNISEPEGGNRDAFLAQWEAVNCTVHDIVARWGGSISAEHGIGRMKVAEHARLADPAKLAAQRAVKRALDPHNILNPGRILAADGG
ncbi:hydroxyacid dehydrogenase [Rhodothalassium salexigens]|uniref:FAD-binding oxidoreductase n=1 Tax=Rhodothalassium salexigens TaxID=1086 RepID=UPI001912F847|nr:FAD-binding oxidoreductase [Rhodothalassium salexigens]MBK5911008.1 hydroxyacid dehydrogenase [Rhodothalassium salexigens]MBK5921781.1 hydroxyacid dehydrogenase [Rhodothalassium salexigens]